MPAQTNVEKLCRTRRDAIHLGMSVPRPKRLDRHVHGGTSCPPVSTCLQRLHPRLAACGACASAATAHDGPHARSRRYETECSFVDGGEFRVDNQNPEFILRLLGVSERATTNHRLSLIENCARHPVDRIHLKAVVRTEA